METNPLALEAYYDLTLVTDVCLSPGGDRVAVVADEFDEAADERRQAVFVAPTDGRHDPHRLTRASSATTPKWSPDGTRLAVLADRDADAGMRAGTAGADSDTAGEDAETRPQVWVFDLVRGGDARQVTDFPEGVDDYDWRPDGEGVVAAVRDPTTEQTDALERRREDGPIETERLQHKFDGKGWLDDVRSYLFAVELESRETERLDDCHGGEFEPVGGMHPAYSPDGGRIAFFGNRTENPDDSSAVDVYVADADTGRATAVTDGDVAAVAGAWSPDGDRYAFVANNPGNWYEPARLYVVDAGEELGDPRCVSESLDRTFARDAPFAWLDEETILGAVADGGRTRLVRFDATGDAPERVFDAQPDDRTILGMDAADGTVALVLSDPSDAPNAFAVDAEMLDGAVDADSSADGAVDGTDESLVRLTDVNAERRGRWPSPSFHRFAFESDDAEVEAFLHAPEGFDPSDDPELPVVVSIHGGPVAYDQPAFEFEHLRWVSEGYAVLRVNYRGSTSYGQAFSEAIKGDYGNREPKDVVAGIRTAVERGWVDADRVYVTGFSYGGAQTAYILSQYDVATVGAAEHGVYDRASYFGTGDSHNRMERDFGLPWENPETYRRISSITDVDGIDVPLLLTAGGDDWRCPPSQSEQLYVSVKKRGVPARLVVYPDEHHAVTDPSRAVHRLRELSDWFERHG